MPNAQNRPDAAAARRGREPLYIGEWIFHADSGVLNRGDEERRLTGKALHVLLVLADAEGSAISRGDLLDAVWGEKYPSDAVVSRAIADLRSAFGESAGEQAYIRTIPKFGYQLIATRKELPSSAENTINHRILIGVAVGLLAAMALAVWAYQQVPAPITQAITRGLPPPQPLTTDPGLEHQPRIAAGGDWIVYAALRPNSGDWDLFRVSTIDGASQAVAALPDIDEHGPAVSPDGNEIAYARLTGERCDVVKQSISFGVPEVLASCTLKFPTLVDWSPNGRQIAYTVSENDDVDGYRRIYATDPDTGKSSKLSDAVSPTGSDFYPRYSPSGQVIAFLRGEPQPDHRTSIWQVDIATGTETRITAQPTQIGGMTWMDDGVLLYSVGEAGRFELRRHEIATGAETVIDSSGLMHPDYLAADNLLVATERRSERDLAIIADGESTVSLASSTSDDYHGRYSPDGALVAFISRRSGYDELWIVDLRDQATRRLTRFDGATVRYPTWHPDGQRILFTVQTDAGERLHEIDVVSGATRAIGPAEIEATTPDWIDDGNAWVYGCRADDTWGICVADEAGSRQIAKGYFRPRPISPGRVAVVDSAGILYSLSLDAGTAVPIWDGLPGNGRLGWVVTENAVIYSAPAGTANHGRIIRRGRLLGEETVLYEGSMPLADTEISLSPKTGAVLFTRYDAASDDLVIFRDAFVLSTDLRR